MDTTATLPATLYLLAYDVSKGRLTERQKVGPLMRGAVLTDLVLREQLAEDGGRAVVTNQRQTGDPVLDSVLEEIATDKPRKWKAWVQRRATPTLKLVEQTMAASGTLVVERKKALGMFPHDAVRVSDPDEPGRLRAMVDEALRGTRPVDEVPPFEAAVTSLAAASQLRGVVSGRDKRRYKDRITALTDRSGAAVPALRKVLQEIQTAATVVVVSAATAGTGN